MNVITRPDLSREQAVELLREEWNLEVEGALESLPSYDDLNYAFVVAGSGGRKLLLKMFHAEVEEGVLRLQELVMERLRERGVHGPMFVRSASGASFVRRGRHLGRVLEWVEGEEWCRMGLGEKLAAMGQVGELNGRVDAALRGVATEEGAERRRWVWRTSDAEMLARERASVERRQGAARVAMFDGLLEQFEQEKKRGRLERCSAGVVHNDMNDHNTLQRGGVISGVIDLGDACYEAHCFSLGNTLFYMMLSLPLEHVLDAARDTVAGYQRRNPLSGEELELAWLGAKLRCLTSATMSGVTQEKHPEDAYVGETEVPGWRLLDYIYPIEKL